MELLIGHLKNFLVRIGDKTMYAIGGEVKASAHVHSREGVKSSPFWCAFTND